MQCKYCDKEFSKKYNLDRHMRTAKYCQRLQEAATHQCEYCDTLFTTKQNLIRHRTTSKYCQPTREEIQVEHECECCGMTFKRADSLTKHYRHCTRYKTEEKQDLARQLEFQMLQKNLLDLQEEIRQLKNNTQASGKSPNFNMVVNNLQPVSEEDIKEQSQHLTLDLILDGASGFASFANTYALLNRYICSDRSRKKFRYKDEEGNIVDDAGGFKLAQKFFKAIAPKNTEIINREYGLLQKQVADIATNNRSPDDLEKLLSKSVMLQNMLQECNDAAAGKHNELSKEFITHLSKLV